MTVYQGTITYKGSKNHKLGETRTLTAGTDKSLFARIFGINLELGRPSNSGQLPVIDLQEKREIYITTDEMSRIDDLEYLKQHAGEIVNERAASRYLWSHHRGELLSYYKQATSGKGNRTMFSDQELVALTRGFLGLDDVSTVKASIEIYEREDSEGDQALEDTVKRHVVSQMWQAPINVFGIHAMPRVIVKECCVNAADGKVDVAYQVVLNANAVEGSASNFKKKYARQKDEFKTFKNEFIPDMVKRYSNCTKHYYLDSDESSFKARLNELIVSMDASVGELFGMIQNDLLEDMTARFGDEDADLTFNVGSAYAKIWSELGLQNDITKTGMSDESLEAYVHDEITAQQFMEQNRDAFIKKLQTVLNDRFTKYADATALAERALDEVSAELHLDGNNRDRWQKMAQRQAEKLLASYADTDGKELSELLQLYNANAAEIDHVILSIIKQQLLEHKVEEGEHGEKELLDHAVRSLADEFSTDAWELFLARNGLKGYQGKNLSQEAASKIDFDRVEQIYADTFGYDKVVEVEKVKQAYVAYNRQTNFFDDYFAKNINLQEYQMQVTMSLMQAFNTAPYNRIPMTEWQKLMIEHLHTLRDIVKYAGDDGAERFAQDFASDRLTDAKAEAESMNEDKLKESIYHAILNHLADRMAGMRPEVKADLENELNKYVDYSIDYHSFLQKVPADDLEFEIEVAGGVYADKLYQREADKRTVFAKRLSDMVHRWAMERECKTRQRDVVAYVRRVFPDGDDWMQGKSLEDLARQYDGPLEYDPRVILDYIRRDRIIDEFQDTLDMLRYDQKDFTVREGQLEDIADKIIEDNADELIEMFEESSSDHIDNILFMQKPTKDWILYHFDPYVNDYGQLLENEEEVPLISLDRFERVMRDRVSAMIDNEFQEYEITGNTLYVIGMSGTVNQGIDHFVRDNRADYYTLWQDSDVTAPNFVDNSLKTVYQEKFGYLVNEIQDAIVKFVAEALRDDPKFNGYFKDKFSEIADHYGDCLKVVNNAMSLDGFVTKNYPEVVNAKLDGVWVRSHWLEALDAWPYQKISAAIDFGFSDEDIDELFRLHKEGYFRTKIENLLEDCNFHSECALLRAHLYNRSVSINDFMDQEIDFLEMRIKELRNEHEIGDQQFDEFFFNKIPRELATSYAFSAGQNNYISFAKNENLTDVSVWCERFPGHKRFLSRIETMIEDGKHGTNNMVDAYVPKAVNGLKAFLKSTEIDPDEFTETLQMSLEEIAKASLLGIRDEVVAEANFNIDQNSRLQWLAFNKVVDQYEKIARQGRANAAFEFVNYQLTYNVLGALFSEGISSRQLIADAYNTDVNTLMNRFTADVIKKHEDDLVAWQISKSFPMDVINEVANKIYSTVVDYAQSFAVSVLKQGGYTPNASAVVSAEKDNIKLAQGKITVDEYAENNPATITEN